MPERGVVMERPGLKSGEATHGVLHCCTVELDKRGAVQQLDTLSAGDEPSREGVCKGAFVGAGWGIVIMVVTMPSLWLSFEVLTESFDRDAVLKNDGLDTFRSSSMYGSRSRKPGVVGVRCVWQRKEREERRLRAESFLRLRHCIKMQPAEMRRKARAPTVMAAIDVLGSS